MWRHVQGLVQQHEIILTTLAVLLSAAVLARYLPDERRHIRVSIWQYLIALGLWCVSSVCASLSLLTLAHTLSWAALVLGGIGLVNLGGVGVFGVGTALLHLHIPRILRDVMMGFGYVGVGFLLLDKAEVPLSSIITTSAVLTAVLAFALQDTLGNMLGGLALQLESSISVGDWVRLHDIEGQVKEMRWRYTAIETRNWDTVIVPNSVLMKGQFVVLGKRTGQPLQHRQWVYFNVDFRFSPTQIITAVDVALQSDPIPGIALTPPAHCIFHDFKDSYGFYAVRYWLTDLAIDAPTDSTVRTRIYFALRRAGIPLSIPAQSVFLTQESRRRKSFKYEEEIAHRLQTLAGIELFQSLNAAELRTLAERLRPAQFARGEALVHQGAEAHSLYILTHGSVQVQISTDNGHSQNVASLHAGEFFGEMGLMTGARRAATVIALEETESYRLDKEAFHDILLNRPEIADYISQVLARRQLEYEIAREGLQAAAHQLPMASREQDIFHRITEFFGVRRSVG
ncbi:MAG: mechanosensitive ion channel [Candidatus Tectomicrobia bacterium]|uniref:Mechanosensitive ion channel n=1 Tax=Tectimicrobiota bacterium TaxID=2528274 RepID=A0A938B2Y3_UNCTE|nr:mechanosensitive ion channel [Candidatus Tectomicrobia bacterium]